MTNNDQQAPGFESQNFLFLYFLSGSADVGRSSSSLRFYVEEKLQCILKFENLYAGQTPETVVVAAAKRSKARSVTACFEKKLLKW